MSKEMISLSNVALNYDVVKRGIKSEKYWALRDISFSLYKGECLGVIGRNGVGKTSLLKVLAGILRPDQGKITFHQQCITSLLTLQLGFSANLSGRENAILSGMLLGLKRKQIEERLEEIIEYSELEEFIDAPLSTYSSGMKARLGFAVSILSDPEIILIDEVLGVGDASFKLKSGKKIKEWINSNKTVVLVSHSEASIKELCDRVVWVEKGKTVLEGKTDEVIEKYNAFNQIMVEGAKINKVSEKKFRDSLVDDPITVINKFIESEKAKSSQ